MVGQSNSNLWFVEAEQLGGFGPAIGRGGVWVDEPVAAGTYSDPFFLAGFDRRLAHIRHDAGRPITFSFEVDPDGTGRWRPLTEVTVPASGYAYYLFDEDLDAEWVRVKPDASCERVTLVYQLTDRDARSPAIDPAFSGLARPGEPFTTGILRPRGENRGTLQFAATQVTDDGRAERIGYYEVGPDMKLVRVDDPDAHRMLVEGFSVGDPVFTMDASSLIMIDPAGRRYRMPKGDPALQQPTAAGWPRPIREVVTERSLFNSQGHLYELPRDNSGGFAKIRPVATSDRQIMDMCSWRGLLVLAGLALDAPEDPHVVRSEDDRVALWFGTIDDLWRLGKPRGEGGPWMRTAVRAGVPSDPYLMTGYDHKQLRLSHTGEAPVVFEVEVDLTGDGAWAPYRSIEVQPGQVVTHPFPEGFNAYWVRLRASRDVTATAQLSYS